MAQWLMCRGSRGSVVDERGVSMVQWLMCEGQPWLSG